MNQPETRVLHYNRLMREFADEPIIVLNPAVDHCSLYDADIPMTVDETLQTNFHDIDYDLVFLRLPEWSAQIELVIRRTWAALVPGGRLCVYADINAGTDLEAVLGGRTSQVPVLEYDEMVFVWTK